MRACVCVCVYEFQELQQETAQHAQALGIKKSQREATDVFFSFTYLCGRNSSACIRDCVGRTVRVLAKKVNLYQGHSLKRGILWHFVTSRITLDA